MKHAIDALEKARKRTVARLRKAGASAVPLEEKRHLDRAIALLRAIGDARFPKRFHVASLSAVDSGAFAEYRLLWDYETEHRSDWEEISLRLSPGDIVITSKAQFEECEARASRSNAPKA